MKIYTIEKKLKHSAGTFDWANLEWVMTENHRQSFNTSLYEYLPNKEIAQELKRKFAGSNSKIRTLEVTATEWLAVANLYAEMENTNVLCNNRKGR